MSDNVVAFGDRTMVADRPVAAAMQPAPPDAPSPSRSSPHILSFDDFAAAFGGSPRRRELLALVTRELDHLRSHGVTPLCLLVGGSFVRDGARASTSGSYPATPVRCRW